MTQKIWTPICEPPKFRFSGKCLEAVLVKDKGLYTRCHKCENCLIAKREMWITRSIEERKKWPKAWFVSLTYDKVEQYDYGNVQRMFKLLRQRLHRKGKSHRIAYMCTDETESSGQRDFNPHHHAVLYCSEDLVYNDMHSSNSENIWPYGHSEFQLLRNKSASYVAKYIQKNNCRIRASQDFGRHTVKHLIH